MANVLKPNTKILHPSKGIEISMAYQVIDRIEKDKRERKAWITFYTFEDEAFKMNRNNSIIHLRLEVDGEDYTTFFSPEAVAANGDEFDLAYQWLMTQEWQPGVLWSDVFTSDEESA